MDATVKEKIKKIVGANNFLDSPEDKLCYSYDGTPIFQHLPEAIIFPESKEQISEVVKLANHEKFNIVPRGSGTGLSGGSIPVENSVVIVMTRWNKILEIDTKNLTATVQPGVVTAKLQKEVENIGLFYPPDPASMNVCTIGGNVAENSGGPRCLKYGGTKDYVLGLEVVLPTGQIIHTGGMVMKNCTGYDFTRLFVGSEGTLGIVTKITLRVLPIPEAKK